MKKQRKRIISCIMALALCVGTFAMMPMAAKAAVKEDVLGKWKGGSGTMTFFEDGTALHEMNGFSNTREYHMETGSLVVKMKRDNSEETLNYDLWRGEDIGDSAPDGTDAVLYRIDGKGTMTGWNIVKENGTWTSYDPSTATRINPEDPEAASGSSDSDGHTHNYEWVVTTEPTETTDGVSAYKCTECGEVQATQPISSNMVILYNLVGEIKNAEAGATVTFENKAWLCYSQYVLDILKEKGDVSLKTNFTYQGVNYSFTIPAGSDYSSLEPADFYGFMYLNNAFGGTVVE